MSAPGHGNGEILTRLDSLERHLSDRISRIEVALMGDQEMGAPGFKDRLERIERLALETPTDHQAIIDAAQAKVEFAVADAEKGRKNIWNALRKIENRLNHHDRRWYLQVGLMVGSGGIGAGLYDLIRSSGG